MLITINSKKIEYVRSARGEPILFVHGWGGNIESLKGLHQLASEEFDSLILSLPGFGESESPDPDWGVGEYANFLINILDTLGIDKTIYFGHSFGGSLGIYLAANHSEKISKLILCGSSFKREKKTSKTLKLLKKIVRNEEIYKKLTQPFKKIFYRIFCPQSDLIKYAYLEKNFRKIINEDLTPLLSKINTETLIIWGENDRETPVSLAYLLHENIKNSKLKIIKDTGHNLPLIKPKLVYEKMKEFLKEM